MLGLREVVLPSRIGDGDEVSARWDFCGRRLFKLLYTANNICGGLRGFLSMQRILLRTYVQS